MKKYFVLLCLLFTTPVEGVRLALEPQNRLIVGAGNVDNGQGFNLSVESRLTHLVYINLGGTLSIPKHYGYIQDNNPEKWLRMNHMIWAAPGWRIPHRYSEKINWDLIVRGGFACVFSTDVFKEDYTLFNPAGLVGLDAYLHYRVDEKTTVGTRFTNRLFTYRPTVSSTLETIRVEKWQNSIELFWQWQ